VIAGRYTLEREVGRGGMGAVWLGRDQVLGRDVALKRIGMAPGGSTPDLARAEREARLAARLNHPHVVAVYDLLVDDDEQWLVMEYVEGTTLAALVHRDGPLAPDTAATLLAQAADALAAAHAAGIVHRDVKPSNMLVTPEGQVKLSDFGIARAEADASLTQTGLVTGSPAYLSPEVASGQLAGAASDVWSLGATLFHALSGRPPYDVGENLMGALYRIVHEEPPRLGPEAGWLAPLLTATMTVDPASRWSMTEVRDALAAGPGGAPPAATTTAVLPVASTPLDAVDPRRDPVPTGRPVAEPAAEPVAASGRGRPRLGSALAVAVAVVVVLVVALVAWSLASGGGDTTDAKGGRVHGSSAGTSRPSSPSTSASSPSQTPSSSPSSAPPSSSASPSSGAAGVTTSGMEGFVQDYLATVTSDTKAAWQHLTPGFQAASGGYGQYRSFWSTITRADLVRADADPASRRITYVVDYQRQDGSRSRDTTTLTLQGADGDYRIAAEG